MYGMMPASSPHRYRPNPSPMSQLAASAMLPLPRMSARCPSVAQFRHQLLAELVSHYREDQQDADDDDLQIRIDARQVHPVLDDADEQRAEHDVAELAGAAAQAYA